MDVIDFSRLFGRAGGVSFPVLIQLGHPERESRHFTSNSRNIIYNNIEFKSAPMSYKFPTSKDGVPTGGVLEIDIDQQQNGAELLQWFDRADHRAYINVLALILENGEIAPLNYLSQQHGTVSIDGEKIIWNLGEEARLNMQVNPWVMDADSLSG